ncbi:MAG: hypothetical protein H6858_07875 [Rhodospirillales bacterium]|nr:hypothetical protein [Alphaproteobacteria bacterium]MCB1839687.1 hypothetical protein [Alphaproteobacteria bacterium]MCB9977498.1 hypothetical protein [Rhodospirillales bacterium]
MKENHPGDDRELFECYLRVCNQALHQNSRRFPFQQILQGLGQHTTDGKAVEVLIIDDQPVEGFCITYNREDRAVVADQQFNSLPKRKWKVTKSYLLDVIRNPGEYINNPAKIDWEWLYSLNSQSSE